MDPQAQLQQLIGKEVVLDMSSPYVYVGTLRAFDDRFLTMTDVDVHDLRDTGTTREMYVVDSRRHGVRWNRRQSIVQWKDVVSVSALEDVSL